MVAEASGVAHERVGIGVELGDTAATQRDQDRLLFGMLPGGLPPVGELGAHGLGGVVGHGGATTLQMREAVRDALTVAGMGGTIVDDIVLATPAAAGNVIRDVYRGARGLLEVAMTIGAERVELTARDEGTWRESIRSGRLGLEIMRRVTDTVDVDTGKAGTTSR